MQFTSHEAYFASVPPDVGLRLESIQAEVKSLLPRALCCIKYNMPAFMDTRTFFYFGAFKAHIGVYPPVTEDAELIEVLAPYRNTKGNLSFSLNQPLPLKLIGRVAAALHKQYKDY
jgi:uncharacterized protein YdhG (YjbR/CyaY superfamily)